MTLERPAAFSPEPPVAEVDSDTEDDPGRLLNVWLGELDSLKQGLNAPPPPPVEPGKPVSPAPPAASAAAPPVLRRQKNGEASSNIKTQYRCSLINLDNTQDDELDAILGELSVLESQFDDEIAVADKQKRESKQLKKDVSPVESDTSNRSSGDSGHSRSSSGSMEVKAEVKQRTNGQRTDSPDTDSAFCDNLSVLSSSSSRTDQSKSSGVSSTASPTDSDQEAKIKAEKIKLAIEKIKEASIKKLFIKVFTADGSAKSLLVDEKMSVGYVTRVLAEKNLIKLETKWSIVELVPDLYMERVYEDHENLVENCLLWKVDSKNTLWFIERPEKYDLFLRPEMYLLGTSSSQKDELLEDHARQELLEEYFSSSGVGAPEVEGQIWLKAENKKSWKKFYFVLRSSGLYYAPKGKKTSKDLVCLSTFDVSQVYYGIGWKKKYKSPTEFCFAIKHPQIQSKSPKYIRYLCVDTDRELHRWVTGIRIAKNGKHLYDNYRGIEEEITHADIDILTSKRLSVNAPTSLQIPKDTSAVSSPVRTPSSENKSLDSALSSGVVSDMSAGTGSESSSTPVNTIDRDFTLRRSTSRSSKSSSTSSGCMSDRSSHQGSSTSEMHGFESDFPVGGTIKKRPTVSPRIPLTTTTWGLVARDEDEDDEDLNIRIGGGGTLLRNAMRGSVRRSQDPIEPTHQVMVHREDEDPLSADFESSLNSVMEDSVEFLPPPPPRTASVVDGLDQVDDLPPPPPELVDHNAYHVSPCPISKPLPPPPPALKNSPVHTGSPRRINGIRKISFDENVQFINADDSSYKLPAPAPRPNPNKLVFNETSNGATPPREFLKDLQRVINKKWQVAEKCKQDVNTTPHQVLGFRDETMNNESDKTNAVGAWVLQTQQYHPERSPSPPPPPPPVEPLYASARGGGHYAPPPVAVRPVILREPTPEYDPYATLQDIYVQKQQMVHHQEVSNYSTLSFSNGGTDSPPPGMSPTHRGSLRGGKRPPPPPRRSETTQLTTGGKH